MLETSVFSVTFWKNCWNILDWLVFNAKFISISTTCVYCVYCGVEIF